MYSNNTPWNRTPARAVIANDAAFAETVENAASRSICVRLLIALVADTNAWVAKTAVNRGAAPYLVMSFGAHGAEAPLDRKVARIDIDTLVSLGLLERRDPPIGAYLGSEVEQAFEISARGRAVFFSASRFSAACEAIAQTRAEQRDRHWHAERVREEIGPTLRELQQDALALGLFLIRATASLDAASLETLPPALTPLRNVLEQARQLAPTMHALAPRLDELAELHGPAADAAAGVVRSGMGLAEG